ncbi:MAG: hypothetical protein KatS3mg105_4296 [Gemmatales bacterium]|nr:MAG: hypothetical protein KatS3mg105_4296 [Gemmatales bacterium]
MKAAFQTAFGWLGCGLMVALHAPIFARAEEPKFSPEAIRFFEQEVKPILEKHCFRCHGGGKRARGGLWLTSRAGILKGGDLGPSVSLTRPEDSLLLRAIHYRDDNLQMPPSGKLQAKQIETLTRWVKLGLPWTPGDKPEVVVKEAFKITEEDRQWWSYQKVVRPPIPQVSNPAWSKNPIDAFILSRLEKEGLRPAPPADKVVLVRRAYYDLLGLPPTPEQVDAFVRDTSPDAYEKLIDRLLESPHYGEKWGRHWLDLVRYAETNGYERDSTKPFAWRYRDYVVRAFNEDKPYNRFLMEQLAGDELPDASVESFIATGYYRLGLWDDEPADRLLAKYDYLDGVLSTTAQAMLAISIGCARCHHHKGDPIPQKDYYSMLAFFENITWSMKDQPTRHFSETEQLALKQGARDDQQRSKKLTEVIRSFERDLLVAMKKARLPQPSAQPTLQTLVADSRQVGQPWRFSLKKPADNWADPGFDDSQWEEGQGGFGRRGTPGSIVRTIWNTRDIWLRKRFGLTDIPSALRLVLHHDEDAEVFLNGVQIASFKGYVTNYKTVSLDASACNALQTGQNVLAVHCRQTIGGQYVDVGLQAVDDSRTVAGAARRLGAKLLGQKRYDEYLSAKKQLGKLQQKFQTGNGGVTVLCIGERGNERTYVLKRGNPHVRGEEVTPGFPAVLGFPPPKIPQSPTPNGTSGRRLALAKWIVDPENPLTARVMVNRIWQHHFGAGLVPTPSDFGRFGQKPSHPKLLDWLASEFIRQGWSIKKMHRLMMTSNTYRMSSRDDPHGLAKDPQNRLLWRFNMRRLSAEEIRDSILAVNGSLNRKIGGPSIYTRMPKAVLQTASRPDAAWGRSPPEEQTRRSIYIFVKRSLLEPFLTTFDLAETDNSCPVRFATTVPTQALTMLNSDFMSEQAAVFAQRLRREAKDNIEVQVELALRLALARKPTQDEIKSNADLIRAFHNEDGVPVEKALEYFCLLVLNLNEFIYLD